jgi:hypothetical protein
MSSSHPRRWKQLRAVIQSAEPASDTSLYPTMTQNPSRTAEKETPRRIASNAVSRADFHTLTDLAEKWMLALVVPQDQWQALARRRTARLRRDNFASLVTRSIPQQELARPPTEIAHDHLALWFENGLNVMRHFTPWRWCPEAELRGFERLREATQGGRGAVLWIADFALQSPFLYAVLARHGIRLSHFSAPGHGYSTTRFGRACLNPILTSVESRYLAERFIMLDRALPTEIRVLAAMRRLKKRVLEGRVVSVSALSNDWGPVHVRILSGKTRLAYGAPGLAHNTGVLVFPVFATREADGRNTVTIEAPLQFRSGANAREAAIQATHDYAGILDGYIRRYPEQWRGWKHYVPGAPAKSSPEMVTTS